MSVHFHFLVERDPDFQERLALEETEYLEREAGKFNSVVVPTSTLRIAKPGDSP
jgi:hypothetical protein